MLEWFSLLLYILKLVLKDYFKWFLSLEGYRYSVIW